MSILTASGGSLSADGNFDDDSIIVEIILHADPDIAPNTFTLTTTSYFDTAKTVSDVKTLNSITTTSDLSGIDQVIIVSEYDQEIPQSQTAEKPVAS